MPRTRPGYGRNVGTYATVEELIAENPQTGIPGDYGYVGATAPFARVESDGTTFQAPVSGGVLTAKKLKSFARNVFLQRRQRAGYGRLFVPSTSNIVYIDPLVAGPGTGSLSDPLNSLPASVVNGYTYLFAEGSKTIFTVNRFGSGIGAGTVFGTYERATGARVITELARLATIEFTSAAASMTAFTLTTTNTGVAFSGLRFTCPDVSSGDRRAIYGGTTSNAISPTIEYCFFDGIDSRPVGGSGVPLGAAIFTFSDDTTIRFCTSRGVIGDQVWIGTNAGLGGKRLRVYGNDFIVPFTTNDGPDGLQFSINALNAAPYVCDNWVELRSNQKQCIIYQQSSADAGGVFANNVFWGSEISLPRAGTNNSKTVYIDQPRCAIHGNIVYGGQYGVFGGAHQSIVGNIIATSIDEYSDLSLTDLTCYFGVTMSGSSGDSTKVLNNTFIAFGPHFRGTAIHDTSTIAAHVLSGNIVSGKYKIGIRRGVTGAERSNVVFGAETPSATTDGSFVALSNTSIVEDPRINDICLPDIVVLGIASPDDYVPYEDPEGSVSDRNLLIAGAIQRTNDDFS